MRLHDPLGRPFGGAGQAGRDARDDVGAGGRELGRVASVR